MSDWSGGGEMGRLIRLMDWPRTGTVIDITERKRAEEALRRINDELEVRVKDRTREVVASQDRLRNLATELNLAGQCERRHLAAELHDYVAQLLALSRIRLAQAKREAMTPALAALLIQVQEVIDQALTYTRTLVAQLSPPMLKEFGLPTALKWLADQMRQRDHLVSLELETDRLILPEDHAMLLFQSVRELLMNVVKHAGTNRARITIMQYDECLHITVADEGKGFELPGPSATVQDGAAPGYGLFSIRERLLALAGRFELHSRPREGTRATLLLPLGGIRGLSAEVLSSQVQSTEHPAVSTFPRTPSAQDPAPSQHSRSASPAARIRVLLRMIMQWCDKGSAACWSAMRISTSSEKLRKARRPSPRPSDYSLILC
jgi:signal transduction histidine kinase